ncbi:CubicO group peptidase (beta-lactamase class C family) [Bradyrhizobium daqingense]
MSDRDEALLDRPIWSALTTSHKHLAEGGPRALRYPVDMTPFADMIDMSAASFAALGDLMSRSQVAVLFTPEPVDVPAGFKVVLAETGEQMIGSPADSPLRDAEIVTLGAADVPAMMALTELTKPGPFAARTHQLGTFLGIRIGGELVAMTGERMKPGKFTEMTAVCVHPDYRGRRLCAGAARGGRAPDRGARRVSIPARILPQHVRHRALPAAGHDDPPSPAHHRADEAGIGLAAGFLLDEFALYPSEPSLGKRMDARTPDFSAARTAMQRYVDQEIIPGASWAVLRGREVVDQQCVGFADREASTALRPDHIFRAFSNTKLFVTCAIMLLVEEGRIGLHDAVEKFLPQLGHRKVLKQGATSLADVEPAKSSITIRQLLTHTSGLSYGIFDPGTVLFKGYNEARVLNPLTPLSDMIDKLADLPLSYHPGEAWEYSVATDVLGRVVEVVSGQPLDAFFKARIFDPLGMTDTGFYVPEPQRGRLVALYNGADVLDPMKPGLTRADHLPYPEAYWRPLPRLSGGGGLVSTLPDMLALVRALLPGSDALLKPETLRLMMTNQLPEGQTIRFANLGPIPGKGFGLGGAVTFAPTPFDPPNSTGEFQWGGLAGTHWWICPEANTAGVLMAQRYMGFWNPFFFEFKRLAYQAVRA